MAMPDARPQELAFALQVVREFLEAQALERTAEALRQELAAAGNALAEAANAALWFDMQQRIRPALVRGGASTLERLVASAAAASTAATDARRLAGPGSPLTVVASPKTRAFDGGARAKARRALRLGASLALDDSPAATPVSAPAPDASARPLARDAQRSLEPRSLKRRASPRSPWRGAAAQHANAHFSAVGLPRVHSEGSPWRSSLDEAPAPPLVRALDASLQRELCAVRLVDRELRHLRLEKARAGARVDAADGDAAAPGAGTDAHARALELERFGATKRVECALCAFPFLPVNLPHRVSFKCVMDVHAAWGYAPPDRAFAAKYRAPRCYDAVRVCRLCSPIVLQHTAASAAAPFEPAPSLSSSSYLTTYSTSASPEAGKAVALGASRSVPTLPPPTVRGGCDPYALPPLFADDLLTERSASGRVRGGGGGGDGTGGAGGAGGGGALESPAKAIVYANQTDATAFMSAKEWEVINPHRSSIRQVMEQSVVALES